MPTLSRRLLLAGTAGALAAPAVLRAQERVVNVYSSRHYDTDRALYDGYTAVSGVRIRLIEGEADALIERIRNEGANSPADVLVTVDAARLVRAAEMNLLQPVRSQILESRVPSHLRDPDGLWFGLSVRARILMVPADWTPPKPIERYEDIADPAFRNTILTRSANHPYSISLAGAILHYNGAEGLERWARGVVANLARPPQGGDTPQILAVAAGQGRIAIANTYYLARLLRSDNPREREAAQRIRAIFPNQADRGAHVNISGAGVVRTAPNREAAIGFIEYLTSVRAQEMFANGNNEYPVVADEVNVVPEVRAWGRWKQDQLNAATYAKLGPQALMIMQRAGWL
ncbi:MAG: extracellular solute-binding protein [Elioraea sp.]|nr:extracellular solute-binding protein [Elioraea sp.]